MNTKGLLLLLVITVVFSCLCEAAVPDISPNRVYFNVDNTTGKDSRFKQNQDVVFGHLFEETPLSSSGSSGYGYGKYPDTVFGYFECFNISQGDCGQCFNSARDVIEKSAPLTLGAQLWLNDTVYKCYLRFENYNFIPGYNQGSEQRNKGTSTKTKALVGVIVPLFLIGAAVVSYCFLCHAKSKSPADVETSSLRHFDELETGASLEGPLIFKYDDLKQATEDFCVERKLGQGGFGAVYKGFLSDGSQVAIKKLSLNSSQGKQEFVNEVSIITGVQHRNLTKLRGYCIKGDERLLVYEFLVNGSLDRALFNFHDELVLDWETRYNIAIGVARGLAYLHEESQIQIIHRDIKASNILLDKDLAPKISDFGISKLFDQDGSSIDTKVAGTYGYMAPEYAIGGRLTVKADVFSFGVLLLELVCGKRCRDGDQGGLLELLWFSYQNDNLEELVDKRLESNYSHGEALRCIRIALLCSHEDEGSRPTMGDVVAMFLGYLELPALPTKTPWYFGLRGFVKSDQSSTTSKTESTNTFGSDLAR